MQSDGLFFLKEKKKYLNDWKKGLENAQEALQSVERNLELTDWEIDTLENRPASATSLSSDELTSAFKQDYNYTVGAFPKIPNYSSSMALSATSIATSGTVSLYNRVSQLEGSPNPNIKSYAQQYTERYRSLQESQQRQKQVRDLVSKFNSPTALNRFDRASKAYLAAKSATGEITQAASEIRNFLYAIKGELYTLARRQPRENMRWTIMSERLAKQDASNELIQQLAGQESVHKILTDQLSDLAKDRRSISITDLQNLWVQVMDHAFTVLGLVTFSHNQGS